MKKIEVHEPYVVVRGMGLVTISEVLSGSLQYVDLRLKKSEVRDFIRRMEKAAKELGV